MTHTAMPTNINNVDFHNIFIIAFRMQLVRAHTAADGIQCTHLTSHFVTENQLRLAIWKSNWTLDGGRCAVRHIQIEWHTKCGAVTAVCKRFDWASFAYSSARSNCTEIQNRKIYDYKR